MEITKTDNGKSVTLAVNGRLDTVTAPILDGEILAVIESVDELILDFTSLEYISSAGLRVLLKAQKTISGHGKMIIKNVNPMVKEIFEVTGFIDILTFV